MMKIVFIHYHLKIGGVSTVMHQQIDSIRKDCQLLVLTGEPPKGHFPAETIHIPGLGYTQAPDIPLDPESVADSVQDAVIGRWPNGCDLIHVHNPTLAKNIHFLKILKALQKRNFKLFLQIHDFAEDGRPAAYFEDEYVSDCHYGVINSRDYRILGKSGLKKTGLHKIFNTVHGMDKIEGSEKSQNRVLYPIRARRRKNIGETILLSNFFKEDELLTITLPPISPVDLDAYAMWKQFVAENTLRVDFDAGSRYEFKNLVASSKSIITTSITEGFGFSFLEPWTAGKLLWGRKLPDICEDFEKNGIQLDHLYTRLRVPVDWLGKEKVFRVWENCIIKNTTLYGYQMPKMEIKRYFSMLTEDNTIDFGLLNERFQKQIISEIITNRAAKQRLISLNKFLADPGKVKNNQALIEHNDLKIRNHYNMDQYRKTLLHIYNHVVDTPVHHRIHKDRLLGSFFDLKHFSLLKWCSDVK
jgi:hypothetical protein